MEPFGTTIVTCNRTLIARGIGVYTPAFKTCQCLFLIRSSLYHFFHRGRQRPMYQYTRVPCPIFVLCKFAAFHSRMFLKIQPARNAMALIPFKEFTNVTCVIFLKRMGHPILPTSPYQVANSFFLREDAFLKGFRRYVWLIVPYRKALTTIRPAFIGVVASVFQVTFQASGIFYFCFQRARSFSNGSFRTKPRRLFTMVINRLFHRVLRIIVTSLFRVRALSFRIVTISKHSERVPNIRLPSGLSFLFYQFKWIIRVFPRPLVGFSCRGCVPIFGLVSADQKPMIPIRSFFGFRIKAFFPRIRIVGRLHSILREGRDVLVIGRVILCIVSKQVAIFPSSFFYGFLIRSITVFSIHQCYGQVRLFYLFLMGPISNGRMILHVPVDTHVLDLRFFHPLSSLNVSNAKIPILPRIIHPNVMNGIRSDLLRLIMTIALSAIKARPWIRISNVLFHHPVIRTRTLPITIVTCRSQPFNIKTCPCRRLVNNGYFHVVPVRRYEGHLTSRARSFLFLLYPKQLKDRRILCTFGGVMGRGRRSLYSFRVLHFSS